MANITESPDISGVLIIEPVVRGDERGVFVETFRQEWLPANAPNMRQGNRADRQKDCLVGFHYHRMQSDYWYIPNGRALVALYDLRPGSPTSGANLTLEMNEENHLGLYIPPGVAHAFYAITDMTITYLVDQYYNPEDELGVAWNDPELDISWPISDPLVSDRDKQNPKKSEIEPSLLP